MAPHRPSPLTRPRAATVATSLPRHLATSLPRYLATYLITLPGAVEDVAKNTKVMAYVKLDSVWFAAGMFGVSLSVEDMVVWPAKEIKSEAVFPGFEGFAEEE